MAPKIILTGFMATGKSAVARTLAKRLGWRHIDCDAAIADDHQLCPQCRCPRPAVIATGGGAIVDPRNFAALHRAGLIICLSARPDVIARRIGRSAKSRPMLARGGKPLMVQVAELMDARREAYARADLTIDTSSLNLEQVVDEILEALTARRYEAWRLSA